MNAGRLISLILFLGPGGFGAEPLTYVYGRVLDQSGAAVSDASVTVMNEDNGFRRATQSQESGDYAVGSLEPGSYKITVRREGFGAMIRFNVRLEPARPARADFLLRVGAQQETITVEGTAPLVSDRESAIGARVYHDEIERLPLNGRGLLALVDLTPGVNVIPATRGDAGQFTFQGQRPNANYFTVDGVSANVGLSAGSVPAQVTGGTLPAVSAFGSLDSLLPLEAIDEFRVKTAQMAPEAARLPGAIVALTSRSGTDEFHGSVAYRFRHELGAANDWFANAAGAGRAPLRMHDVAPSIGGPIRRNRAFFFGSVERLTLRGPYVWQQVVPSSEVRNAAPEWLRPAISLYPEASVDMGNGAARWSGRNVRPSELTSGMLRIDQALTSQVTLFGRYNESPSSGEFGSAQVSRLDLGFRSLTIGLNARLSPGVIFDFRVNESQSSARSTWSGPGETAPGGCDLQALKQHYAVGCDYLVRVVVGGMGQVASGREGERRQRQFESIASASLAKGGHLVRLGLDFRRITAIRRDAGGMLSLIANDASELVNTSALWYARSPALNNDMAVVEVSGWLQDEWQAGPRLTVTTGVRWQVTPPPVPRDPVYFYFPPGGTFMSFLQPLWPRRSGVPAPRLGLAYRLDRAGATILRAGAGMAYDSTLSIATDFINSGPLGGAEYRSAVHAPFSTLLSYGFMPDLRPPRIAHWTVSLDRAFGGGRNVASVAYVGSMGRNMIRRELGGEGNTPFTLVALTTNRGWSKYQGLHMQYRRRISSGLDAIASYAWSHSIDNDSSDAFFMWAGPGTGRRSERGSSDFDLRQTFTAAFSYEFPQRQTGALRWLGSWAIDCMFRARTGFPMTVLASEQYLGIPLSNAFRPYLMLDRPVWLADSAAPGGKRLNPAAFLLPSAGVQGTLGRNAIAGFGMNQADVAIRREFRLSDRRAVQFRLEAFNAANTPNFADPVKALSSALFGQSTSMLNLMLGTGSPGSGLAPLLQTGGSRSVQAAVRLRF